MATTATNPAAGQAAENQQQQAEQQASQSQAVQPILRRRETSMMLEKIIEQNAIPDIYAKQLLDAEVARELFDQDHRLARVFALSGVFGDLKKGTEEQNIATAMAKIRLGRSWGINEADAIQFIFFTNGRPAVMNELYAAKLQDSGFDWDTEWMWDAAANKRACTGCRLWLKKFNPATGRYEPVLDRNQNPVSEEFTKADADGALIWEGGKQIPLSQKWNFVSWARDMYFWRALSRLRKFHAPNVLKGAVTQIEAQDIIDLERVDATPSATPTFASREAAAAAAASKIQEIYQKQQTAATTKPEEKAEAQPEAPVEQQKSEPEPTTQKAEETDGDIPNDAQEPPFDEARPAGNLFGKTTQSPYDEQARGPRPPRGFGGRR